MPPKLPTFVIIKAFDGVQHYLCDVLQSPPTEKFNVNAAIWSTFQQMGMRFHIEKDCIEFATNKVGSRTVEIVELI